MKTLVLRPRMSEKTYAQAQNSNVYVFAVPSGANKQTVARAVAEQLKVTVEAVNIMNLKGKAKRTVRKGGRPIAGRQSDTKKAYVTVKAGDTIPVFAAIEEAERQAEKTEKAAAKATAKADDTKDAAKAKEPAAKPRRVFRKGAK